MGGDENDLKLGGGDGCTTENILKRLNSILCELSISKMVVKKMSPL